MSRSVIIKDLGWQRIVAELARMEATTVDVGIHDDAGSGEEGTPIAAYASYNEYGTGRGVPERSFLRSTFDETIEKLNRLRGRLLEAVYEGRMTAELAGALLGEQHSADIKRKIGSNLPPPNAPSTVRAKGSSSTLIDSGAMRQAVRYEVNRGSISLSGLYRNFRRLARHR
jgi:hypothetical protein